MSPIVAAIAAYLIGSVSFAVIMSRVFALPDPRSYGSKNPGATNVLRTGHKAAALCTLIGDGAKGWLAVFLAGRFSDADAHIQAIAAVAVVAGHLFPVFHRFAGGKGVATAAGVLLGLNVWLGLGTLATWGLIAGFFRISSLAAVIAALFAPFFAAILFHLGHVYFWGVLIIAALLIWRHRTNLANLIAGTEGRIGERRTGAPTTEESKPS